MKRTEKTTAKHLSFSSSSLHSLQRKAVVLPLCIGRGRGLSIALLLAVLWLVGIPVGAKSITIVSPQPNVVAAADTSMVAYTEKKTRTKIPSAYKDKIDSVLKENLPVIELNGTNSWSFTTDFVIKEMESDWGISKDNQLLFIWNIISKQLAGDYIYDGEDGDSNRLEEYRTVVRTARLCGQRYKDGIMPFIEKKVAENKQQIAEKDRQIAENKQKIAEKDRQIAENKLVSFTNSINKYNDFINKYSKNLDPNMVKEALNIISEYNLKIGEFKKRAGNLATQLNNQHLSASEIESIKNMAGQLCSDIDTQRNAMHKKRIAIVEKANDVVEKKKAEVQQKVAGFDDTNVNPNDSPKKSINKVNETIAKFKKSIEEAKTNNNEDKLSEAEDWQLIASNYLQIAEKDLQIAENKQKIAENKQKIAENKQKIAEKDLQIAENKQKIVYHGDGEIDMFLSLLMMLKPTHKSLI